MPEAKESPARHLVPKKEAALKLNRLVEKDVPAQFKNKRVPGPKQLVSQPVPWLKITVCAHFRGQCAHSLQFSGFVFKFSEHVKLFYGS
jgi:hypothetical protein